MSQTSSSLWSRWLTCQYPFPKILIPKPFQFAAELAFDVMSPDGCVVQGKLPHPNFRLISSTFVSSKNTVFPFTSWSPKHLFPTKIQLFLTQDDFLNICSPQKYNFSFHKLISKHLFPQKIQLSQGLQEKSREKCSAKSSRYTRRSSRRNARRDGVGEGIVWLFIIILKY